MPDLSREEISEVSMARIPDAVVACQGPVETERGRSVELNGGGRESCAVVAIGTARWC